MCVVPGGLEPRKYDADQVFEVLGWINVVSAGINLV
jgi:hypothetical protein